MIFVCWRGLFLLLIACFLYIRTVHTHTHVPSCASQFCPLKDCSPTFTLFQPVLHWLWIMGVTKRAARLRQSYKALSAVLLGLTRFCNYVLPAASPDHGLSKTTEFKSPKYKMLSTLQYNHDRVYLNGRRLCFISLRIKWKMLILLFCNCICCNAELDLFVWADEQLAKCASLTRKWEPELNPLLMCFC